MRIYWIGEGKPSVPSGLRHIGGNVYETHDSHAARELGGTDARWSMSRPVAQKMPPQNDPNRALRAEMAKQAAKDAKVLAAQARARGETVAVVDEGEETDASGRSRTASGQFQKAGAKPDADDADEEDEGDGE